MTTAERRKELYELIKENKELDVNFIRDHFKVSAVTVRNDLIHLERNSLVTRQFGKVVLKQSNINDRFENNSTKNLYEKEKIGRYASKLIANVLDISPILAVEGGLVVSKEKVRGSKKVISKLCDIVKNDAMEDPEQKIYVLHGNKPETAQKIIEKLKENTPFTNFTVDIIGPCIGIHAGPGAFGIIYQKKN